MSLPSFLVKLFEDGQVRVGRLEDLSAEETRQCDEVLAGFESQWRREMPGDPPLLDSAAARWAAAMFYRACQFAAYRDVDEKTIATTFRDPRPEGNAASTHYSVDLVFRFLPDLTKLARSAAERDPLVEHVAGWAVEWPLSSVGMPDVGPVAIDAFVDHPGLLGLYVDRIIARGDTSRLAGARVCDAVREALGLHDHLAPKITAALNEIKSKENQAREVTG